VYIYFHFTLQQTVTDTRQLGQMQQLNLMTKKNNCMMKTANSSFH